MPSPPHPRAEREGPAPARGKGTRRRLLVAVLGAVGLLTVAAYGIAASSEPRRAGYRLAALSRGALVSSITASGTFRPTELIAVTAAAPGQIREVTADISEEVETGDVLARLDDAVARAHLASVQAELAVARGRLERAKSGVANAAAVRTGAAADVDHANEGVVAAGQLSAGQVRRTG